MKINQNSYVTVFLISTVVLVAAIGFYVYLFKTTTGLVDRTLSSRKILSASQATKIQSKEIMNLYSSTVDKRATLSSYFASSEKAVDIIQTIESISDSTPATVVLSSIKTALPTSSEDKIGQVTASVVIRGSWKDMMQAVELFEVLPYVKSIKDVNLNMVEPGETSKAIRIWQANFDIVISTIQKS